MTNSSSIASTPAATAAIAQTRTGGIPPTELLAIECPGCGTHFQVDSRVRQAVNAQPYEREMDDPIYRPLKIFTLDPSSPRLEGSIALVNVPYEPLEPGPTGKVFRVEDYDESQNCHYSQVDLNDPAILIRNGRDPSPSDWLFHQQMVYVICSNVYACFRTALGRKLAWAFDQPQLRIRPHACYQENAYYNRDGCELCFGYYRAKPKVAGLNLPGGFVFTCLSHDIVAHEVTHALLDGLRAHFAFPTGPDVLAFHEAFADLVAVFLHFSYKEVLQTAIRKSRGELQNAKLLTEIARQFNYTITGQEKPLRCAVDIPDSADTPKQYDPKAEPHELGSVLVAAVFEAFNTVFKYKTERYIRLATGGSGVLPIGEMSPDLQAVLADEASKLASQFLTICIRAIDYCPPLDLEFGEFLRAVITADRDLVPDDHWGYREAWIDAFRRRSIYPSGVANLSEDALLWHPEQSMPPIEPLNFAALKFKGDPGSPSGEEELQRQACVLGQIISQPDHMRLFGLTRPDAPCLGEDTVELPCVQSIRSSRRIGPNGQVVFDLVAEVTQRRIVRGSSGNAQFYFYGGSTLILGPDGKIRYIISKSVVNEERLQRQRDFLSTDKGHLWEIVNGMYTPKRQLFMLMHQNRFQG